MRFDKMPMFNGGRLQSDSMTGLVKAINFDEDSDIDDRELKLLGHHAAFEGISTTHEIRFTETELSPDKHKLSSEWNSVVGSPIPGSSPLQRSKPPSRRLGLSPIPFAHEDSGDREEDFSKDPYNSLNESGIGMLPTTPIDDRIHCRLSAPGLPACTPLRTSTLQQSMRRMKLTDGSRSPKRFSKHISARCQKFRNLTSTVNGKIERMCQPIFRENSDLTPITAIAAEEPQTNINPFASDKDSIRKKGLKRLREEYDWSYEDLTTMECIKEERPCKKLAFRQFNTSRLKEEFHIVCSIGDGQFGSVDKCINRLDGCTYAIKKSKFPVAGSVFERNALHEVYAHAVLGKHVHIVGYYSAWAEHDHMFIQNEYCNGGCLSDALRANRKLGKTFTELELKHLMCQLVHGLKYIHSYDLAHLDLKPDNIFICIDGSRPDLHDSLCGDIGDDALSLIIYKIGDFGMVTPVGSQTVDEGDCRYLPKEILQESFDHLQKADIFSLAITIFEAGSGLEMPKNGPEWQALREIGLPTLPNISIEFNNLLQKMASCDPTIRPSAAELSHSNVLLPFVKQTDNELRKELEEQKLKNEQLLRQLDRMKAVLQTGNHYHHQQAKKRRLVGRPSCRTLSSF